MVCPQCGTPVGNQMNQPYQPPMQQAPMYQQPMYQPVSPAPQVPTGRCVPVLVFGIISLALAYPLGPITLAFAIVALVMAGKVTAEFGTTPKMVSVGRGLAIAGLIVSAIVTLLIAVAILIPAVVGCVNNASSYSYTYSYRYY